MKSMDRMLHGHRLRAVVLLLTVGLAALRAPSSIAQQTDALNATGKPSLTVDEIISRMAEKNRERAEALRKFRGTRVYRMQYHGFFGNREAEMTVTMDYASPDGKVFTIISESGTKFVIDHVFKGLLDAEKEAATVENQRRTALSAENYSFTLAGFEDSQNSTQYVLNVVPKTDNKFLYRGKVWIDAKDFAVVRVEAEPAKSPSFWVKKTEIRHRYEKVGDFWLPAEDRTESSIRLGGHAFLSIDYNDYEIKDAVPTGNVESGHDGAGTALSRAAADFAARTPD